jgi:hypothetical protein
MPYGSKLSIRQHQDDIYFGFDKRVVEIVKERKIIVSQSQNFNNFLVPLQQHHIRHLSASKTSNNSTNYHHVVDNKKIGFLGNKYNLTR